MLLIADVELTSMGALLTQNPIDLGPLTAPITLFASVGVINAINMSDRIDGLSGVCVSISLGFIALLSFSTGSFVTGSFCLVTICSMAAFLLQNFRRLWHKKALVYLGDAGSTMLRFILAWLLISSTPGAPPSFEPVYALWFIAIPLFDTVNLIINRPLRENSTFSPGHDHLHHTLLTRGLSVKQVIFLILFLSLLCGGIGLLGISLGASQSLMFQIFIAVFSIYFLFSDRVSQKPATYVAQS
jgi:UDP-GlcNAc:undecaprenyl-phosphate GlcNAc-1-phosphate transferase